MRLYHFWTLVAILASLAASVPSPQGNCGSCAGGTYTRIERAVIERELPPMDMTGFIQRFHARVRASQARGDVGEDMVTHDSEEQGIDFDQLGNNPFYFRFFIGLMEPGTFSIGIRMQSFLSLIEQFRAINHHVTVHRYQIQWELRSWRLGHPSHVIPPVDLEEPHDVMGQQTVLYERATEHRPMHEYIPLTPAYFDESDFIGRNHPLTEVKIHWKVTIEYEA